MNIIYVDDDDDDIAFFGEALKMTRLDITLNAFQSWQELQQFLSGFSSPIAFVFIDVNMPKVNGYQCASRVRAVSDAHIVLVSSYFNQKHQNEFMLSGISYMEKSVSIDETVQLLQRLLNR